MSEITSTTRAVFSEAARQDHDLPSRDERRVSPAAAAAQHDDAAAALEHGGGTEVEHGAGTTVEHGAGTAVGHRGQPKAHA